jgi:hypothetical protein
MLKYIKALLISRKPYYTIVEMTNKQDREYCQFLKDQKIKASDNFRNAYIFYLTTETALLMKLKFKDIRIWARKE